MGSSRDLHHLDPMCTVSLLTSCATEEPEIPVLAELNLTGFSWESTCLPYLLSMNPHNLLTAASHANHTPVKVLLYRVICHQPHPSRAPDSRTIQCWRCVHLPKVQTPLNPFAWFLLEFTSIWRKEFFDLKEWLYLTGAMQWFRKKGQCTHQRAQHPGCPTHNSHKMSYMYIPSDAWIVWLDTYFQLNTQMSGML